MSMTFATDVVVNNGQSVQANKILAPMSSGGSTYGAGANGQILKSNGTGVYWAEDQNTTYDAVSDADIIALFTETNE